MDPELFTLLIVDDEKDMVKTIARIFKEKNYNLLTTSNSVKAVKIASANKIDCAIVDLKMPEIDGIELMNIFKEISPSTYVIIITAYGSVEAAVEAVKQGAINFYEKPFCLERLISSVSQIETIINLKNENAKLKTEADFNLGFEKLIGLSSPMLALKKQITDAAGSDAPVIITGETGSGKEIAARALHLKSSRNKNTFSIVDCTTLPETVMESELFGHTKGSFTGALHTNPGLIKTADNGTLFLDEIAEIPYHLQSKLLRVIQEKEIRPVGGLKQTPVNIRIIAATNRNIEEEIKHSRFREDLYYRLNVVRIKIPPLRKRREDIPHLCSYFFGKYSYAGRQFKIDKNALDILMNHDWLGNVRELENTIRRALIFASESDVITPEILPDYLKDKQVIKKSSVIGIDTAEYRYYPENSSIQAYEKAAILNALNRCSNNRFKAANLLSISKATLYRKLKEYSIGER